MRVLMQSPRILANAATRSFSFAGIKEYSMPPKTRLFTDLLVRTKRGDADAALELEAEFRGALPYMIRRVLREGQETAPLDRWLGGHARRIARERGLEAATDQEELIRQVAAQLAPRVVGALQSGRQEDTVMRETQSLSDWRGFQETVSGVSGLTEISRLPRVFPN
jgi:hypothetical protein